MPAAAERRGRRQHVRRLLGSLGRGGHLCRGHGHVLHRLRRQRGLEAPGGCGDQGRRGLHRGLHASAHLGGAGHGRAEHHEVQHPEARRGGHAEERVRGGGPGRGGDRGRRSGACSYGRRTRAARRAPGHRNPGRHSAARLTGRCHSHLGHPHAQPAAGEPGPGGPPHQPSEADLAPRRHGLPHLLPRPPLRPPDVRAAEQRRCEPGPRVRRGLHLLPASVRAEQQT
mmetsp:Transcript_51293/g.148924  ORF Transcript_51293/g.148924 Transcript_51293/m.148924 type:complete len:227 (-) Transcript_51293:664-1344(-)